MGHGGYGRKLRDPEAITSFTVPVIAPNFFLITSLVRTVSDSMVFYRKDVVSFCYYTAVTREPKDQRNMFSAAPTSHKLHLSTPL